MSIKNFTLSGNLYNMVHGTTPLTFIILPLLGKHPDKYPRFRDCFFEDKQKPDLKGNIHVYTRVGGGNRESYQKEISELREMEGFITDYDDDFDSTYATFVYKIPEKYKNDVKLITEGKLKETSKEYQNFLIDFWKTKSSHKDFYKKIEAIFSKEED